MSTILVSPNDNIIANNNSNSLSPITNSYIQVYDILNVSQSTHDISCSTSRIAKTNKKYWTIDVDGILLNDLNNGNLVTSGDMIGIYNPETNFVELFIVDQAELIDNDTNTKIIVSTETPLFFTPANTNKLLIGVSLGISTNTQSCFSPSPIKESRITSSSVRLHITQSHHIEKYKIRYKKISTNDSWQSIDFDESFVDINGLDSMTEYIWQVIGFCQYPTVSSFYNEYRTFTTTI